MSGPMHDWLSRPRVEARDLVELVLLPGLAAVLPWPLCFRLFRRLSRWGWPYRAACEAAPAEQNPREAAKEEEHEH